ncbi:N-acetyltransferase family protein [Hominenteromicrobium sp.]|uniref:GNAT family N-acetyltransferase n=1 Tax=Hominenteromicrobium sp. TaxID=3073581 RepID=UPI00399A9D00
MQSFTLRSAGWEDLPAFKHIARTTLTEDVPALFDPNKLLEDKKIGFEYIMAAEQNGEVVGFCCRYACRDADTPYCAEIFSLYVLPKAQHSGIGRAFVEDALAILYISGFKICKVWLPAGNRRAREFFEAAGFTRRHISRRAVRRSPASFLPLRAPPHAPGQKILPIVKSAAVYLTHRLRFYVDFIFPQTFYKLAESRPAKTDKMPLYNIPL